MTKIRDTTIDINGLNHPNMTLDLECWTDELNPAQLAAYEKAESEHFSIRSKLNDIVSSTGGENLFLGEIFSAYQVPGLAPGLETIAKPVATVRKENRARQQAEEKKARADRELAEKRKRERYVDLDDEDDQEYVPLSKRMAAKAKLLDVKKKEPVDKKSPASSSKSGNSTSLTRNSTIPPVSGFRPTENSSIGGLSVGENSKKKEIVDLTKDDGVGTSSGSSSSKPAADSREITFNKLQGKTFPSLVVVARPSLKIKDNVNDRPVLDAKVKGVLMHTATKFTEWLIQQGLVRSEQSCQIHHGKNLKLGMYSDATKFPYSGGYVWISECCPTRFVSVFNGSLFEGATHPPSVLLKLIYHWACQTNVQNVVQWVKVDNLYVKGIYTWLRSVCTVALYQHMNLLGGHGKKIEVGVISLGTTSQDGQQRQVKVEVLGVLDYESKIVRLRAVEPLSDGERNYKKRFSKILEPLSGWVHKDSQILTDMTVDKGTLQLMGYKHIIQASANDNKAKNNNANIMDYLRRIVPRMFQNTLSLLSRQIIQQFLDELVWREWYGTTPGSTFDNIVSHISEQTRLDAKDTLVARLNKVAANPFKNWGHLSVKTPPKALRDDFFNTSKSSHYGSPSASSSSATASGSTSSADKKRAARKRREPSPEYTPYNKNKVIKEEPVKKATKSSDHKAAAAAVKHVPEPEYKKPEVMVQLESFYYGILKCETTFDSAKEVPFKVQCPLCHETFHTNITLMDHLKQHANPTDESSVQCQYCLENWSDTDRLGKHHILAHPIQTKNTLSVGPECIICEVRFSSNSILANHMQKTHVAADLPYKCGCCSYASSALRHTINHFYNDHADSGALQCPFCLQIYIGEDNNGVVQMANIIEYLEHLKFHLIKSQCKRCSRCALAFVNKGSLKVHSMYAHASQSQKSKLIIPMCKNSTKIAKPKYKSGAHKENILFISKYYNMKLDVDNGKMCLECDTDLDESNHIVGVMKCQKCKYHSSCLRTFMEHASICSGINLEATTNTPLDREMHCICGFSSSEGNALARHLATCDRRSAYHSAEAVQENTVKRNMLDMLGLVRREEDEESDDLLQPVDTNDRRSSTNRILDSDDENIGGGGETDSPVLPPPPAPGSAAVDPSSATANTSTGSGGSGSGGGGTGDEPMDTSDHHQQQFNTSLSLDDLAPPSVAPQPETDRTPQLSDEYQSLATPRVAPPTENMAEVPEDAPMPQSEF